MEADTAVDAGPWRRQAPQGPQPGERLYAVHREMAGDTSPGDIATGDELARAATGSPVRGLLFPAPGLDRDLCGGTFTDVSHILAGP